MSFEKAIASPMSVPGSVAPQTPHLLRGVPSLQREENFHRGRIGSQRGSDGFRVQREMATGVSVDGTHQEPH